MQIIDEFEPTVMIAGHNAALTEGVYWHLSQGHSSLARSFGQLAESMDVPIAGTSDSTYVGKYYPGINYPITARLMADHDDYIPYLGDSSGGYMERVAAKSIYAFSEMPLFLHGSESVPSPAKVNETMERMRHIVELGASALSQSGELDDRARPYVQSLELLTNIWQQGLDSRTELEQKIHAKGPAAEVFRCTRILSSALRLADMAGADSLSGAVQETIRDSAEEVSEKLIRSHSVRDMVRMQAGTFALAALCQSDML